MNKIIKTGIILFILVILLTIIANYFSKLSDTLGQLVLVVLTIILVYTSVRIIRKIVKK